MAVRHFLSLKDFTPAELRFLITRAHELKATRREGTDYRPLQGKVLAMLFEKSSTRTRVSFEAAMSHFGGNAIFLSPRDTQLGRGEPIEDTARVLSRMVDAIMVRTYEHEKVERLAAYSSVPVINALTDRLHPCQLLADMQTFFEMRGEIKDKIVAWIGDGNNMCQSYINAMEQFEFHLRIASPENYRPNIDTERLKSLHRLSLTTDPREAADNADLVVTDVWASMGQETEQKERYESFRSFQVNEKLMRHAKPDALFMHCLPAHRGEEVTAEVLEGKQSVVWEEAGNRLHSQKALLEMLLT